MRKVFISGKVSGMSYTVAQQRFNEAAMKFRNCNVVNPTKLCDPKWSWWRCMVICLWHLLWCDAVLMLRGWDMSRGAMIEHRVAKALNKVIMYEDIS